MANAINTGNPVSTTKFIINKYEDIQGGRVNQETPRGRLAFLDTNGRYTLPRTTDEAAVAAFVVDWAKPLNPPPYFEGPGLNGAPPYAVNDGSLNAQETGFLLDRDQGYQTPWPLGVLVYDRPPMFYGFPVTSGNKCLVFDGGTFTFGSGNYVAPLSAYVYGAAVYPAYTAGDEGKVTYAASGVSTVVGRVFQKEVFGSETLTVIMKGVDAL
jgi:hypothetical protein